jgi:thiol-disulfide isomerase/thioredoxin
MVNNYRFSPIYMEKRKDQKFGLYSLTAEQRKFMNDMPSQNDTTFRSDMFRDYLSMVFNLMYEETAKVSGHSGWSRQKVAGFKAAFYQDKFNELSLAQGLESNIGYAGITTEAQAEYDAFLKAYPNSAYKEPLQKTYEKMLAFAKGKPAIPFTLKNEKGEVVKLQDFKNKVVYLDFWASWCGPCIQEMKASKPVKAHFKDNQDLVFLYISIDEKVEDWRAGMEKHEVEGVNLWAEKAWQDPIAKAYNIVGIPKYYLIDGEGKFNDSAPPRASQNEGKDLIKTLEAALATLKK